MVAGHLRIYNSIDDITLDIPHAYTIIQKIVQKSSQKKLISDRLKLQCPNKWVLFSAFYREVQKLSRYSGYSK